MNLQRTFWIVAVCLLSAWMFRNYRLVARRNLVGSQLQLTSTASLGQITGLITRIAISSDGKLVAAGSRNGYTNVWNLQDGKQVFTASLAAGCRVRALAFDPSFKRIFTSGCKNQVQVDDLQNDALATAPSKTLIVKGTVTEISMEPGTDFSEFHSYYAPPRNGTTGNGTTGNGTTGNGTTANGAAGFAPVQFITSVRTPDGAKELKSTFTPSQDSIVRDSHFTPDKKHLALLCQNGQLLITDRQSNVVKTINIFFGVDHFQFFNSGRQVVAASVRLIAFDLNRGQTYNFESRASILAVRVLPGEKQFETLASDGTLMLHDIKTGHWTEKRSIAVPDISAAEFTPDGTKLITGNYRGEVAVWPMDWGK